MNKILLPAVAAMLCLCASAQPKGVPARSTYEVVDEMRKELNLDHDQFEKVYSAYEKYNKTVFGDVENNGNRPTPPPGAPRTGNGSGPNFGEGHPHRHPGFDPQRGGRPGGEGMNKGSQAQELLFGSPLPPSLTATIISRAIFVKVWARLASAAPLVFCMLCHLECPDIYFQPLVLD